jgi:hypothetical protein
VAAPKKISCSSHLLHFDKTCAFNLFSSNGMSGKGKIQLLLHNHGQYGHFNLYASDVTWCFHGSDRGCESLNQWHVREPNFFKDKLRIVEHFGGTEGILAFSFSFFTHQKV